MNEAKLTCSWSTFRRLTFGCRFGILEWSILIFASCCVAQQHQPTFAPPSPLLSSPPLFPNPNANALKTSWQEEDGRRSHAKRNFSSTKSLFSQTRSVMQFSWDVRVIFFANFVEKCYDFCNIKMVLFCVATLGVEFRVIFLLLLLYLERAEGQLSSSRFITPITTWKNLNY